MITTTIDLCEPYLVLFLLDILLFARASNFAMTYYQKAFKIRDDSYSLFHINRTIVCSWDFAACDRT